MLDFYLQQQKQLPPFDHHLLQILPLAKCVYKKHSWGVVVGIHGNRSIWAPAVISIAILYMKIIMGEIDDDDDDDDDPHQCYIWFWEFFLGGSIWEIWMKHTMPSRKRWFKWWADFLIVGFDAATFVATKNTLVNYQFFFSNCFQQKNWAAKLEWAGCQNCDRWWEPLHLCLPSFREFKSGWCWWSWVPFCCKYHN